MASAGRIVRANLSSLIKVLCIKFNTYDTHTPNTDPQVKRRSGNLNL